MTQKAIVNARHLVWAALAAALPVLASCQTADPRDTTFVWNLASDPPDRSHPAYAPAQTPTYQAPTYAPAGRVDVRPLGQPGAPGKTSSTWSQPSTASGEPATLQTASANPSSVDFVWPLRGRVISEFGTKLSGERNDGINIAATLGAPIHAAANGTVTYAGDGLKGYGNLVLIRHAEGYVTAYAHADTLTVTKGDIVSKGQIIGYAGDTGGAAEPQLHFEIRHGTTPVNPRSLLAEPRA
jgi:murein DD-endopeptidase MepM/ murein hydrolase activator NlpD